MTNVIRLCLRGPAAIFDRLQRGFFPIDDTKPPEHRRVSFVDITDRDGQLAHFASISFVGALPAGEREALLDRLGDILDRNGVTEVRRPHVAELWLTRRLPDPAPAEARPAAAS